MQIVMLSIENILLFGVFVVPLHSFDNIKNRLLIAKTYKLILWIK